MSDDKEYEILEEGNEIVKRLRERYPKAFWPVVAAQIVVLLITNKPRPWSMKKLAKITKVDAAHRTILKAYAKRDVRYVIEVYNSDWARWNAPRKQWILGHEIGHIADPEAKGLIQHDIQDFGWLIDAVGIDWWAREDLPNLLDGDPFPFRQELFDRLHVRGDGDDDADGREEGGDSHGTPWGTFASIDANRGIKRATSWSRIWDRIGSVVTKR